MFKFLMNDDYAIDSLNVFLPVNKIHFTDLGKSNFTENIATVNLETGEVLDVSKNRKILIEKKGVKLYALFVNMFGDKYISLGVSSKFLEHSYLSGISYKTVKYLYVNVINRVKEYMYFDLDTFLNSTVSDVDFKYDFKMSEDKAYELYNFLNKNIQDVRAFYIKSLNDYKTLTGYQVGNRRSRSDVYLFFKFYNKYNELMSKSSEFYNAYPFPIEKNLWRFEFTLKRNKHFNKFLNRNKSYKPTLNKLLDDVSRGTIKNVVKKILIEYFPKNRLYIKPKTKKLNSFSANEILILASFLEYRKHNPLSKPLDWIKNVVMPMQMLRSDFNPKSAKIYQSRLNTKLKKMLDYYNSQNMFLEL